MAKPLSKEEFIAAGGVQMMEQMAQQNAPVVTPQDQMRQGYEASERGRIGKIGEEQVREASKILEKYKAGKTNLEKRVIENEQFWKMRHWEQIRKKQTGDPEPASAWLFNSLANKHADAEDNYPEPNVLAREENDKQDAKVLSDILPVVLDQAAFPKNYSLNWWSKLKHGTAVYGIFWDNSKRYGLGDIAIEKLDILNLFWEPGISDIQKSRNLFVVELRDNDLLLQEYPFLKDRLKTSTVDVAQYIYDDTVDTTDKSCVVSWYYKVQQDGRDILHYVKYVNDDVLYASENDPYYKERGFYDHGKYPVVFDVLFPEEGTPAGFGYVDVMKDSQVYIDKLNQNIIKSSLMATRPRYFVKDNGAVNETEFGDWSKDFVHVSGSSLGEESMRQIKVDALPEVYVSILNNKIEELKETSGNRDFSQGSTTSGVTAASAIAALQEAGSKLSRDMIKQSYMAYEEICYFAIELIRQFYDEPRQFRIIGELGAVKYINYSNERIKKQAQGEVYGVDAGYRMPVFDIKITAQKASAFSKIAQNELAKELYGAGFFNPQMVDQVMVALEMMDFEGKEMVEQKVSQNGTLLQTVQQLQMTCAKLAAVVDRQNGTSILQGMQGEMANLNQQLAGSIPGAVSGGLDGSINPLGALVQTTGNTTADTARERAQNISTPK